jgi:hypothetical protein
MPITAPISHHKYSAGRFSNAEQALLVTVRGPIAAGPRAGLMEGRAGARSGASKTSVWSGAGWAWSASLSEEMTASVALLRLSPLDIVPEPLRGTLAVHVRIAFLGSAAEGARLVAPMRQVGPALIDTVGEMPYQAVGSIHADPPVPLPVYGGIAAADGVPRGRRRRDPAVGRPRQRLPARHGGTASARRRARRRARGSQRGDRPRRFLHGLLRRRGRTRRRPWFRH